MSTVCQSELLIGHQTDFARRSPLINKQVAFIKKRKGKETKKKKKNCSPTDKEETRKLLKSFLRFIGHCFCLKTFFCVYVCVLVKSIDRVWWRSISTLRKNINLISIHLLIQVLKKEMQNTAFRSRMICSLNWNRLFSVWQLRGYSFACLYSRATAVQQDISPRRRKISLRSLFC